MQIQDFISKIRSLIADGLIEDALDTLLSKKEFCIAFTNDIMLLKSRFSTNKIDYEIRGIIPHSDSSSILNRIKYAILQILDKIEKDNFKILEKKTRNNGELLYRIPINMVLGREVKCIVRISYSLDDIIKGLVIDSDTQIQSVQISEVMSIELIDINQQSKFSIRNCTDEEQFIIHDDYTQWIFYVKPLEKGNHKLLIKCSVIEVINNKERKKNIVLERIIDVSSKINILDKHTFKIVSRSKSKASIDSLQNKIHLSGISKKDSIGDYTESKRSHPKKKIKIRLINPSPIGNVSVIKKGDGKVQSANKDAHIIKTQKRQEVSRNEEKVGAISNTNNYNLFIQKNWIYIVLLLFILIIVFVVGSL